MVREARELRAGRRRRRRGLARRRRAGGGPGRRRRIRPGALELLLARIGANTRLLIEEVHKLAAHAADGAPIDEASVAQLTPNAAQGDFFETADAFFSGDLQWTLAALKRHFFAGGRRPARPGGPSEPQPDPHPGPGALGLRGGQGRPRGIDGLAGAAETHGAAFGDALAEKSSFNLFTQNPWYVGKLAGAARMPSLRRLIDNQRAFIDAFEEIIQRPDAQADVLRDMAVRCLAA